MSPLLQRIYNRLGWGAVVIDEVPLHLVTREYHRISIEEEENAKLTPMERAKTEIAQDALARFNGNRVQAARWLGISRNSLIKLSRQVGVPLFLISAHLCPSVALAAQFSAPPAAVPPAPQSALLTSAVRSAIGNPKPNASVWLKWSAGDAEQTLVSYSNQTTYAVGSASIATITGLVAGSTNTFAVTNLAGASNLATGIATRGTNRINTIGTITIYAAGRIPGRTNWLLTSTNLLTWTRAVNLGTNAGAYTFLVTNGATSAMFYQTLTE